MVSEYASQREEIVNEAVCREGHTRSRKGEGNESTDCGRNRRFGCAPGARPDRKRAPGSWNHTNPGEIQLADHPGCPSTVVTRLCIDQLRSARVQREQYVSP